MKNVVIIGNGVAGITCARELRKRDSSASITVISRESQYHYSRPALMYLYMGHMQWSDVMPYPADFWAKNRIELVHDTVVSCDTEIQTVTLASGATKTYTHLVLATGSSVNKFGWPGQDAKNVQGLYTLQDIESMETSTAECDRAVIVGGGLIGIEMCEMLLSRGIEVTFLVREAEYWNNVLPKEEAQLVSRHIGKHGVDLRLQTELAEIRTDTNNVAVGVRTKDGEKISCSFVGLTAGVHPNTDLAEQSNIDCGRGVLVNQYLQTNIPNVYAVGDCAEILLPGQTRGVVEQLWYTGKNQGIVAAQNICDANQLYERGIWYNSAKFMELDYHTYGQVPATSTDSTSLFWQCRNTEKCLRIAFDDQRRVTGFNSLGIRLRHKVCEQWIADGASLRLVVQQLSSALFDPEFSTDVVPDIVLSYNARATDPIPVPKRKNSFWSKLIPVK